MASANTNCAMLMIGMPMLMHIRAFIELLLSFRVCFVLPSAMLFMSASECRLALPMWQILLRVNLLGDQLLQILKDPAILVVAHEDESARFVVPLL